MVSLPPPVRFATLPSGWHSFRGAEGAYALSWNYRPGPGGWATKMPRNGIVVSVFFPPERRPHYPPLRLVIPGRPATTLEGAPDTPEYRIHGRVRGRDVEVWIDIRRKHPTETQLHAARRVWPTGMISHVAGAAGNVLVVVEAWESKAAQEQFMQSQLGPAFAKTGAPEPTRVEWLDQIGGAHRD